MKKLTPDINPVCVINFFINSRQYGKEGNYKTDFLNNSTKPNACRS